MKKFEFETSKGRFLVSESDEHYDYRFIGLLSRITEEQASEIVQIDEHFHGKDYYKNYINNNKNFLNPIESLHSLLKSKGIHLFENPYEGILRFEFPTPYKKSEQKTFYNPYIFKL